MTDPDRLVRGCWTGYPEAEVSVLLMFSLLAWGESPSGRIDTVVVYPDRAAVTRVLEVPLVVGVNHISFHDLPPTVQEQTIQAEGNGVEGAQLLAIDVVSRELVEDRRARVAELEAQIATVQEAIRVDQDAVAAAKVELAFLTSLQTSAAAQASKELFFTDRTAAQATAIAGLLHTQVPEVQARLRTAEFAAREKEARRAALQRELDTTRGASQWARRDVNVDISSPKAGNAEIRLTYILPGAGWVPTYDVRAFPDEQRLGLTMSAQITQTSGEDWSDVVLSLSTAVPAQGTTPPGLSPFYLSAPQPPSYAPRARAAMTEMDEAPSMAGAPPPPPPPPMAVATASVTERAVATTFEVPGRGTVPGDGTRRKLRIVEQRLETKYIRVAVPRFDAHAWLVGEVVWKEAWPLLAGEVASFLEDSFVGTSRVGRMGTGDTVQFAFGVDDAVKVESEALNPMNSRPNLFGQITSTRNWRYTVTNNRKSPVTVELRDRIPQTTNARYKVRITGDVPEEQSADGLCTYVREVAPGQKATATFGYTIRYPRRYPPGAVE